MSLLDVRGLSVSFGALRAVDQLDLTVEAGQIVGLIGPNGAGKTTFIDALTGFVGATGRITFGGHELTGLPPHRRSRLGLARTWQSLELFDDLTVEENLKVAAERRSGGGLLVDLIRPARSQDRTVVDFALDVVGIADLASQLPTEISHGQRKLVGVARALAGRPKLVCMDEPAAGLDTTESAAFGRQLRRIRDTGVTVLLVDHDMGLVLDVCDHVYVLEFGRRIADGTPQEVTRDERVITAYLGSGAHPEGDP